MSITFGPFAIYAITLSKFSPTRKILDYTLELVQANRDLSRSGPLLGAVSKSSGRHRPNLLLVRHNKKIHYWQKYQNAPPNHWIQVFQSPQVYKSKHPGIQTASTNICERMGRSQRLTEFKCGTVIGCHLCNKSIREWRPLSTEVTTWYFNLHMLSGALFAFITQAHMDLHMHHCIKLELLAHQ